MPVTYRVGLIGCGRMGATIDDEVKDRPNAHIFLPYSHAAAIVASERTKLVAVCDSVPEKAEAIGQRYGAQKAYSDHEAMIDAENLDMVAVATRPGPHAAIVRYAAERGVRINAVVPTLAVHDFLTRVVEAEHLDAMAALQPQGRPAEPVEVANAIVFLASDLSGYLTGECISASAQKP